MFSASRKVPESRVGRKEVEVPPPLDPLRDPLRVGPPRGGRERVPPYGRWVGQVGGASGWGRWAGHTGI